MGKMKNLLRKNYPFVIIILVSFFAFAAIPYSQWPNRRAGGSTRPAQCCCPGHRWADGKRQDAHQGTETPNAWLRDAPG